MAQQPIPQSKKPGPLKLPYRDDPSVAETFVDAFHMSTFDGAVLHMELTVNRMDEPKPPRPPTGYAKTAVRLVMPATMVAELYNNLAQMVAVMAQKGLVTMQGPPQPATPKETVQ